MKSKAPDPRQRPTTGIVFSGGGARGAYEAGVLAGLIEVLNGAGMLSRSPFDVCAGSSVGAIHASWTAAHSDSAHINVVALTELWRSLSLREHLRPRWRTLLPNLGGGLVDSTAFEQLVRDEIPWRRLRENIDAGMISALIISALHIRTGTTVLFADLAEGQQLSASRDRRRRVEVSQISAEHVLASAALPMVFPTREIGGAYYCDGGVRLNTPIAPALRAGATRIVVIPLLSADVAPSGPENEASPSVIFLLGKLLDALLLDPIVYDLAVLERVNQFVKALDTSLSAQQLADFRQVLSEMRGTNYRAVQTLVFRPSEDLGAIARERADQIRFLDGPGWALAKLDRLGSRWDTDLLSFVLFDGDFAARLIELGRNDVVKRANEVTTFFAETPDP